jgi:hypothetical protein
VTSIKESAAPIPALYRISVRPIEFSFNLYGAALAGAIVDMTGRDVAKWPPVGAVETLCSSIGGLVIQQGSERMLPSFVKD